MSECGTEVRSTVSANYDYGTIKVWMIPLKGGGHLIEFSTDGRGSVLLREVDFNALCSRIKYALTGESA